MKLLRGLHKLLLPPPRRICNRRCLSVCLSVSNFAQKLTNRFAWNIEGRLAIGQWTNDWILVSIRICIRIMTLVRRALVQWRSRAFGRLVRWSNLPPYCLRFWASSSTIAEGPRDALSQLKSCQLLHNCTKNQGLPFHVVCRRWMWSTLPPTVRSLRHSPAN